MLNGQNHLEARDMGAIPDISSKIGKANPKNQYDKFAVKYYKANMDEPGDMLELASIETRALHSKPNDPEIVLIEKDKFTFMDKYFIILKYLERI